MPKRFEGNIFLDEDTYKNFIDTIAQIIYNDWSEAVASDEDFIQMDNQNISEVTDIVRNDIQRNLLNAIAKFPYELPTDGKKAN